MPAAPRAGRGIALLAAVCTLGAPSIHSQGGNADSGRVPDSPLMVIRDWSPVVAIMMALPAPEGTHRDRVLARAYDRALFEAFREATADSPAQVDYGRDGTGRYFAVVTDAAAVRSTLDAMRRIARTGPSPDLVGAAVAGISTDLAFRGDLPRARFDRIMSAYLLGGTADTAAMAPAAPEGLAAEATAMAGSSAWGPPVWVVVGSRPALSASLGVPVDPGGAAGPGDAAVPDSATVAPPQQPLYVARTTLPGPGPLRAEIPSDAVTRWVGSVFRFPPGTTLVEAVMMRLALEESVERVRDPNIYELTTEIDAQGRLVVRFSTSTDAGQRWDMRLDDTIADLAAGPDEGRLTQALRPARSRWSQELSAPAGAARAAAQALLRGASYRQAEAFANSAAEVPEAARISAVARGLGLSIRVVYGGN